MTIHYVPQFDLAYNDNQILYLDYTNWRGIRSWRRVVPLHRIPEFRKKLLKKQSRDEVTATEEAWTLRVYDLDRKGERSYVLKNIHEIRDALPEGVSFPPEEKD